MNYLFEGKHLLKFFNNVHNFWNIITKYENPNFIYIKKSRTH